MINQKSWIAGPHLKISRIRLVCFASEHEDPEELVQQKAFFSYFYLTINIGTWDSNIEVYTYMENSTSKTKPI